MSSSVLVVEPSRTIRTLLEIFLQRDEHQAVIFASYGEARYALTLPQFRTYSPEVVFVALHTSQLESRRLIEELRRRYDYTFTRIVAMIAQEESGHHQVRRLTQDEQIILLLKPFLVQDALALVSTPTYTLPNTLETR
jgi:DNA-binding response OmpR family regulator